MSDWLARKADAEREWFRKSHEKQFGKPPREVTEADFDKVIDKFKKQSKRRVSERKYFAPTVFLPPPLEPVEWTGAPLALKCVCPTGDCTCTCNGNTLLPKKSIPFVLRYNWWGLKSLYWKLPGVKYPQPAGTLAQKFADDAKVEWYFYRSEEGRKILTERGPEFCLSGCLKFFITDRKMEKNFTALITEMKANVNIEEPLEAVQEDVGDREVKKIFTDRICDQYYCTVSTQSEVDRDGEFVIGDYSHLLFGSNDENLLCDIDGAELHIAAYKDEPEDPCGFSDVSRTVDKLFHVTEMKGRISRVKKSLIASIFEIPERFNSKASQYECKDIPIEAPEGVCEPLADVRRKRKEEECLKKKLEKNKLDETKQVTSDKELSDKDNFLGEIVKVKRRATDRPPFEKVIQMKDSTKCYLRPADTPYTSKNLINSPCNKGSRLSDVTKSDEDSKPYSEIDNIKQNIESPFNASQLALGIGDPYKSLPEDEKIIDITKLDQNRKIDEELYQNKYRSALKSVDDRDKVNITNERGPCKFKVDTDESNLEAVVTKASAESNSTKGKTETNETNIEVLEPKESSSCKSQIETEKNYLEVREPKENGVTCICEDDVNKCWESSQTYATRKISEEEATSKKGSNFSWKTLFGSNSKISKKSSKNAAQSTSLMKNSEDFEVNCKICYTKSSDVQNSESGEKEVTRDLDNKKSEKVVKKSPKSKKVIKDITPENRKLSGHVNIAEQDPNKTLNMDVKKYYRFYF